MGIGHRMPDHFRDLVGVVAGRRPVAGTDADRSFCDRDRAGDADRYLLRPGSTHGRILNQMFNNLLRILGAHLFDAVLRNWFSTLLGVLTAVALAWPTLEATYLAGRQPNEVHWALFGAALWAIVWGALTKFAINFPAITKALLDSAPRAQQVVPKKGDSLLK